MAKSYIVQVFDRSINDWYNSKPMSWDEALNNAYGQVEKWMKYWNNNPNNRCLEPTDKKAFNEAMENGQNWVAANHVIGITNVTTDDNDYQDKIVLIKDCDLNNTDIRAIQMPFDSESFFRDYMKRVCEVFGGCYRLIGLWDFDENYQKLKEEYQYIVHTKIKFN